MLRSFLLGFVILALSWAPAANAQTLDELDPPYTTANFTRAYTALRQGCEADNGQLWGVSLCAPLMVVHQRTRMVLASEAGSGGLLRPLADGVWTGTLPADVHITVPLDSHILEWAGVRWSIVEVIYGVPEELSMQMLSEGWRNAQASLGIPPQEVRNRHLESERGRYYLRLEMRALVRALRSEGDARREATLDALSFRAARHALFPNDVANEIIADRNDGLALYTGVRLALGDQASAFAARTMEGQDMASGYEHFYAELTGPAYGLLLDEQRPNWRRELGERAPADLLARRLRHRSPNAATLLQRGDVYAAESVGAEERQLTEVDQTLSDYVREMYETYSRVELPLSPNAQIEFDASEGRRIPAFGIQTNVVARDVWGEVRGFGVISEDRTKLILAEPSSDGLSGPGWTISLAPGYRIAGLDGYAPNLQVERIP